MASAAPSPRPSRAPHPHEDLRRGLLDLTDRLRERPRAEKPDLLPLPRELCRALREARVPHGLPHLVLRNLLADLRGPGAVDGDYHAARLAQSAALLGGGGLTPGPARTAR